MSLLSFIAGCIVTGVVFHVVRRPLPHKDLYYFRGVDMHANRRN